MLIIITRVVDCQSFERFCHRIQIILSLTFQDRVCILSLCIMCDRLLTEIIHSCVMGLRFLFYNDSTYCILNLLIVQWFTVKIIAICYGYLQFCIVFVSWSSHTRSFVPCATLVQDMFSTFEYVKIAHLIDYWIIRK